MSAKGIHYAMVLNLNEKVGKMPNWDHRVFTKGVNLIIFCQIQHTRCLFLLQKGSQQMAL